MFDAFDRIRIVNLAYRRDRRAEMEDELAGVGLRGDPRVAFFPAVRPEQRADFSSIGARGIYESQRTILAEAAASGHSILILEDDCDFAERATTYQIPGDWDIFYGGYDASSPSDLKNSDIVGAHMMGFSRTGAKRVSEYLRVLHYTGMHPPIDAAYVWFRRAYPEVRTVFAEPPLGYQRSSRTDIADLSFYDRWAGIREVASGARRLKRAIVRRRI